MCPFLWHPDCPQSQLPTCKSNNSGGYLNNSLANSHLNYFLSCAGHVPFRCRFLAAGLHATVWYHLNSNLPPDYWETLRYREFRLFMRWMTGLYFRIVRVPLWNVSSLSLSDSFTCIQCRLMAAVHATSVNKRASPWQMPCSGEWMRNQLCNQ
jgi:hypothetical protein